jgi:hypothetical protein
MLNDVTDAWRLNMPPCLAQNSQGLVTHYWDSARLVSNAFKIESWPLRDGNSNRAVIDGPHGRR